MDTRVADRPQAPAEIRSWEVDFGPLLTSKTGVTVSSATATHTPPSGSALTPTVLSVTTNVALVRLPAFAVGAIADGHFLDVLATCSNSEILHVRLVFNVAYLVVTSPLNPSTSETFQFDFDYNNDLRSGVTISSAAFTLTLPSGTTSAPSAGTIASGIVPVSITPTVKGVQTLDGLATLSDGDKSAIRLKYTVSV